MRALKFFIALALGAAPLVSDQVDGQKNHRVVDSVGSLRTQMLDDLTSVKSVFSSRYAPRHWKEEHLDWDLETEYQRARQRIRQLEQPNAKQFQRILKDFLLSMQDYHVQIAFWATEEAHLPFLVRPAEGRYFISYIDRDRLPERTFPFNLGDELISFDGRPVADVVAQVREQMSASDKPTDESMAAMFLTHRIAAAMPDPIPRGPIAIAVQPQGSEVIQWVQLVWDYSPEEINQDTPLVKGVVHRDFERRLELPSGITFKEKMMKAPLLADNDELEAWFHKRTLLPPLGEVVWRFIPDCPGCLDFDAYIYRNDQGQNIGFVRIPDYIGDAQEVATFGQIMGEMELQADLLIIDQLDNPGGSVFYLYGLAGHLATQPLVTPRHTMSITQEDVANANSMVSMLEIIQSDEQARMVLGYDFFGYPVDYTFARFLLEYARFILDEWNAGRWMTRPYYIWGVDHINPSSSGVFTKPVMILINEMDLSGGDFFPAILQDNGRALVVGTTTGGAGGYVKGTSYPNILGVELFTYTGSIGVRPDQAPIENLGVTPDIELPRTARDLQNGYQDFAAAVNKIAEGMLVQQPLAELSGGQ